MEKGIVKKFDKGFGFIKRDDGTEVFVHYTALKNAKALSEGDQVQFEVVQGERGLQATDVTVERTFLPYYFVQRTGNKKRLRQFHSWLGEDRYDVAFSVTWTAETELALNPCKSQETLPIPKYGNKEVGGIANRWLTINNKLAISPFTVKSAIANGFANLLGGCVRVMTETKGHDEDAKGKSYNYNGKYKRYRVSQTFSRPGIIETVNHATGEITVRPVKEFYSDDFPGPTKFFEQGKEYWGTIQKTEENNKRSQKFKPPIVDIHLSGSPPAKAIQLVYAGEYEWGMGSEVYALQSIPAKKHVHRFYQKDTSEKPIPGMLTDVHFQELEDLERLVYMGNFKNENPSVRWYQDLSALKVGDFVYYEVFNGKVTDIGKNFLFKALFNHEDTVPEGVKACNDEMNLCPRCSMFGFVGRSETDYVGDVGILVEADSKGDVFISVVYGESPAEKAGLRPGDKILSIDDQSAKSPAKVQALFVGEPDTEVRLVIERQGQHGEKKECILTRALYLPGSSFKGRFKSSTLVSLNELQEQPRSDSASYPGVIPNPVPLKQWVDNAGERKAWQVLLPIQSSPKPNKRDVNGYFDRDSGEICGAKQYEHFQPNNNLESVPKKVVVDKKELDYPQDQRRFAQVAGRGMQFEGTIGAENCTATEAAALLMLLEASFEHHGFKIGLGKDLGLGSVSSSIEKVWLRTADTYDWQEIRLSEIMESKPQIAKAIENMRQVKHLVNSKAELNTRTQLQYRFPRPDGYWRNNKPRVVEREN